MDFWILAAAYILLSSYYNPSIAVDYSRAGDIENVVSVFFILLLEGISCCRSSLRSPKMLNTKRQSTNFKKHKLTRS